MHLKEQREAMGYSIGELAACLGIPKATYQCYENGTRQCPADIVSRIEDIREKDRLFFAGLPARIDARIDAEFSGSISSKINFNQHKDFS